MSEFAAQAKSVCQVSLDPFAALVHSPPHAFPTMTMSSIVPDSLPADVGGADEYAARTLSDYMRANWIWRS